MRKHFIGVYFLLMIVNLNFVFAQDTNILSGGEEDQVNYFLQKSIAEDPSLKSKAEEFNGKRSGVYDGISLVCPYAFERDLYVGISGEDVRLLQILLNTDPRTVIAEEGPGSLGKETNTFGESTKISVKKFQTLFIEYIGVANGRFGPRTRTVMNGICNGVKKPSVSNDVEIRRKNNIYDNVFSVQSGAVPGGIVTTNTNADNVAPRISVSSNVSSVKIGEVFKVILTSSEEIVPITPDSLIIDGGGVKEIRKLSRVSYSITININEDAKKVLIQIEADKIEDLSGNKNESASNEISVKVISQSIIKSDKNVSEEQVSINSLLDKIIASSPNCTYSATGLLIQTDAAGKPLNTTGCATQQTQNPNGQTYNCNGQQIPTTQPCQQQTQTQCTTTLNPFTGLPQQQCQQVTPQQAQQQQQAQQNQQLGQLLGGLLNKNGFGGNSNSSNNGGTGSNGSGGNNNSNTNTTQDSVNKICRESGSESAACKTAVTKLEPDTKPKTSEDTTKDKEKDSFGSGGDVVSEPYVCVGRKLTKDSKIVFPWTPGGILNEKYVILNMNVLVNKEKQNLLLLYKKSSSDNVEMRSCYVGGAIKDTPDSFTCCKQVTKQNGKLVCEEHNAIKGKVITKFLSSLPEPKFTKNCGVEAKIPTPDLSIPDLPKELKPLTEWIDTCNAFDCKK